MRRTYEFAVQALCIMLIMSLIAGAYFFLARLPPPATTPQNIAYLFFLDKNYPESIKILRELVKKEPDNVEAKHLLALSLLRNQERFSAMEMLRSLHESNPSNTEIALDYAEASIAQRDYPRALGVLEQLVAQDPSDAKFRLLLGNAYFLNGFNLKASETYQYMIDHHMDTAEAKKQLQSLYGLPKYDPHILFQPNQAAVRPDEMQISFRTNQDHLETLKENAWHQVYIKGINLTAASPGHYVGDPPREFQHYKQWFKKISDMNCNVVRAYLIYAPAFYQALKAHNEESEKKLWLFQEIWLFTKDPRFDSSSGAFDLYNSDFVNDFKNDITNAINAIHGRASIQQGRGRIGGIYVADVSQYVIGFGLGKELEPYTAIATNAKHSAINSFQGNYVSLKKGNPTEAWYAAICDFAVQYETDTYNAQRPITVVNMPYFDSIKHPSESSKDMQNQWEERYGLPKTVFSKNYYENDATEIDITRFTAHPSFKAGLFACYHVYPYWPDFIWADSKYQYALNPQGHPDPYYGYLKDLKDYHKNFPILVGEYGVATSWYPVRISKGSENMGGYNEREQAQLLVKWTQYIHDLNYAGGVVFQYLDEWWHPSTILKDFQSPNSMTIWFNVMDAEQNFGVETFCAPAPIPLLRGQKNDWEKAEELSSFQLKFHKEGELKKLYATSDFAFLYLRLDIEPWKDDEWKTGEYWLALSTFPGHLGSTTLPEINLELGTGATFLIQLKPENKGKILIAENYNVFKKEKVPAILGGEQLVRKGNQKMQPPPSLQPDVKFEEISLLTQNYHIGTDGTIYPARQSVFSDLRYGTADPLSEDFNSLAAWHVDLKIGMIELRIPWMLLYFADPSRRNVLMGFVSEGEDDFGAITEQTPGIGVVAIHVDPDYQITTLPQHQNQVIESDNIPLYSWKTWVEVPSYDTILKKSYYALQEIFNDLNSNNSQNSTGLHD